MNISATYLAALILAVRTLGRPAIVKGLTLSQATIKAIPGRQNPDVAEIQSQASQLAEQTVQLAEAVYDKDWADPDLIAVSPDVKALHEQIVAHAKAA